MYEIIAVALLTVVNVTAIIIRTRKKTKVRKLYFSQSGIHSVIRDLLPSNSELRKPTVSQSKIHNKEKNIKVVYTPDQKAYWVVGNIFYCADLIDGEFDPSTGRPISADNLSKKEIEKLLFILDNLNG